MENGFLMMTKWFMSQLGFYFAKQTDFCIYWKPVEIEIRHAVD